MTVPNITTPGTDLADDQSLRQVYQYTPIRSGEIRVIALHPSLSLSAPLVAELEVVYLNRYPQYEALSYVWGEEESEQHLEVSIRQVRNNDVALKSQNGISDQCDIHRCVSLLPLKKNLEAAFRRLRLQNNPRYLWIDAICINQADLLERKEQVEQMGRIYSQASKVPVWLGEGTNDVDIVFDTFDSLEDDPDTDRGDDLFPRALGKAIDNFFARPWWTRRWVQQEVALAREDPVVLCGSRSTNFDNLILLITRYRYVFDFGAVLEYRLNRHTEIKSHPSRNRGDAFYDKFGWKEQDLIELMTSDSNQQATDPRDHIYGMLNLTTSWYRNNIEVDYTFSVSQVYQQAMFAAIKKKNSLDIFKVLKEPDPKYDLPSWTHDFSSTDKNPLTNRTPNSVLRILEWGIDSGRNTHEQQAIRLIHNIKDGILSTKGLVASKIIVTVQTTTNKSNLLFRRKPHQLLECIKTFLTCLGIQASHLENLLHTANQTASKLSTENLYRTMVAGNTAYGTQDTPFDFGLISRVLDASFGLKGQMNTLLSPESGSAPPLNEAEKAMLLQYLKDAVLCAYWGSAYFCTDSGRLGLSSRSIRNGDTIAILHGASLPAVLRQAESSDGTKKGWKFVGFAFVRSIGPVTTMENDEVNGQQETKADSQALETTRSQTFELV